MCLFQRSFALKLQNCQISLELDLLMRPAGIVYQWTQTPVSGFIGRRFKVLKSTSFATKKVNAFQVNFSEFNNKLVAAFTTNGVENSVSFHCLTFFFLLWMLKKTFTTFPVSFQVFWCLEYTTNCFIFFHIKLWVRILLTMARFFLSFYGHCHC